MDIMPRVEMEAVICSFWPFSMGHSKLCKIQSAKKFLAVNDGEGLILSWLWIGFEGW